MSRPVKLKPTKARRDAISDAVAKGANRDDAARAAGISPRTLYRWLEHGEADEEHDHASDHRQLWQAVQKAEGEAMTKAIAVVRDAIDDGDWKAAMTFLERKDPARWARRVHVKDETPRSPVPLNAPNVEAARAAFAASFGDQLPDVDPANLMHDVFGGDDADQDHAATNGRRNGKR